VKPFLEALGERVLLQDGAKGTSLFSRGLPSGELPDSWNLTHPFVVKEIHQSFVDAGCDILVTNTFGSIRPTLKEYGLENRLDEINRRGVELARAAGRDSAYIAASIPPIGQSIRPLGDLDFEQAVALYREQASSLDAAGVDLFNIETSSDLRAAKAAMVAIRSVCNKPIVAMMSFGEDDRTLLGVTPQAAAIALEAMGADVIGANCSRGIEEVYRALIQMSEVSVLPKIAQPNAGLPVEAEGVLRYPISPEVFASYTERLIEIGAGILGGCCGTTPDHIHKFRKRIQELGELAAPRHHPFRVSGGITWLCGRGAHVGIGKEQPFAVIGERINPTRRPSLQQALRSKEFGGVLQEARDQIEAGAVLLDVNIGLGAEESASLMEQMVSALERALDIPLVLDSADASVLEAGLRQISGKALINSVTADNACLGRVLPLVRKYGAAVIGLCVDEQGLPKSAEKRLALAEKILKAARQHGIRSDDLLIDPGVVTIAADPDQANEVLRALSLIKEKLNANTCLGLSNISHGLPGRAAMNASFLAMAIQAGLDSSILDPLQKPVMDASAASGLLLGKGPNRWMPQGAKPGRKPRAKQPASVLTALMAGDKDQIVSFMESAIANGDPPQTILDRDLLPAMKALGEDFKAHRVYLPQVMAAAETMQTACKKLGPLFQAHKEGAGPIVVLATVEGDVHDIGKNLVRAMLEASGFCVLDLGKSVPASRIVTAALEQNADLICLSALMTTTMRRMEEVVLLSRERGLTIPILIGGAVVTEDYARSIQAHYAPDAVRAVDATQRLTKKA
jgi:5-methyltetrahydrofolate--homocysteine methyltransferase